MRVRKPSRLGASPELARSKLKRTAATYNHRTQSQHFNTHDGCVTQSNAFLGIAAPVCQRVTARSNLCHVNARSVALQVALRMSASADTSKQSSDKQCKVLGAGNRLEKGQTRRCCCSPGTHGHIHCMSRNARLARHICLIARSAAAEVLHCHHVKEHRQVHTSASQDALWKARRIAPKVLPPHEALVPLPGSLPVCCARCCSAYHYHCE